MACQCRNCASAVAQGIQQYAVSLAVIHTPPCKASGAAAEGPPGAWLLDCGPDIKAQWRMLQGHAPGCTVRGVFLTHLHMYEAMHSHPSSPARYHVCVPIYLHYVKSERAVEENVPWASHNRRSVHLAL